MTFWPDEMRKGMEAMTPTNPTPEAWSDAQVEAAARVRHQWGWPPNHPWSPALKAMDMQITREMLLAAGSPADRITALEEALRWFLEDPRFVVSVGGNPNVVDRMLAEARRRALGAEGEGR